MIRGTFPTTQEIQIGLPGLEVCQQLSQTAVMFFPQTSGQNEKRA
jgi:hypothetical protein